MDGRFPREAAPALLALEGEPVTFAPSSLPGHRMLTLTVRNAGRQSVSLRAADVTLLDDAGSSLRASIAFGRAREATVGTATMSPGGTLSLDLVWRARPEAGIPSRLELAGTAIDLAAPEIASAAAAAGPGAAGR